jgi:acyl-CoA synthetase (NDP forming)
VFMEDMITDAVAEVIVGVARDPLLGLHLMIGTGGVMSELMRDTALVMIPAQRDEINKAIDETMVAALLDGYRGRQSGDRDALIDLVMAVQEFTLDHEDCLEEMDINPVLVRPKGQGAVAVDALIRWAKST